MSNFIFRWAEIADIDAAADTMMQAFEGESEMGEWVRMMMDGRHASASPATVAIAEEAGTKRIAAVITTAPQTWYYSGIPLQALNITEVGTHPDFRGNGLISKLMNMIHQRVEEDGYHFSLVWGVPWFYKKFGYYQTLGNKASRTYARAGILSRWEEQDAYQVRPMTCEDIPFGVMLHTQASQQSLIYFPYDEKYWNMFAFDYFEENRDQYRVIEKDGRPVGIFSHNTHASNQMSVYMFDLIRGVSWLEATPRVTAYLLQYGDRQLQENGCRIEEIAYSLRQGHPVFEIMRDNYSKERQQEQNYYRIPEIKGFLSAIKPVLEQRLGESFICGYTKKVKLQLFGLKELIFIHFDSGKIIEISSVDNVHHGYYDIHMPLEIFMHLLFGQMDIDDCMHLNREVGSWNDGRGVDNELRILLKVLFPKKSSYINHCL